MTIIQATEKHKSVVGPGSAFAIGDSKALISQRNSEGKIRTYACLLAPEQWNEAPTSLPEVAALYSGWSPDLLALITDADAFTTRRLSVLPPGHSWPHNSHVTLLGDAAHVLLPTGEGANLALLDSADLAEAIMSPAKDSIAAYEQKMCKRARDAAEGSIQVMRVLTDSSGPQAFMDMMASFGPPPEDNNQGAV
jgi:2-polyprenyl-6-methoxyphenol hydroxylase-like FAD-dependent oxidoreductase